MPSTTVADVAAGAARRARAPTPATAAGGALADLPRSAVVEVDAAHPGLRRERHQRRAVELAGVPLAQAVALLGEHDDRAALGRLVGEAGQLRGVGELAPSVDARRPGRGRAPAGCPA